MLSSHIVPSPPIKLEGVPSGDVMLVSGELIHGDLQIMPSGILVGRAMTRRPAGLGCKTTS